MEGNHNHGLSVMLSDLYRNKKQIKKFEEFISLNLYNRTRYEFAKHLTPSDILSNVIQKILTGKIIWNVEKISLVSLIYYRIRSEIFNLVRKERKMIPDSLDKYDLLEDGDDEYDCEVPVAKELIIYPFDEVPEEERFDSVEFRLKVYKILKNSPEEFCVFDDMCKGLKSRQIAAHLGISLADVHNIKRRIMRVLKSWLLQNKNKKIEPLGLSISKSFQKNNGGPKCAYYQ